MFKLSPKNNNEKRENRKSLTPGVCLGLIFFFFFLAVQAQNPPKKVKKVKLSQGRIESLVIVLRQAQRIEDEIWKVLFNKTFQRSKSGSFIRLQKYFEKEFLKSGGRISYKSDNLDCEIFKIKVYKQGSFQIPSHGTLIEKCLKEEKSILDFEFKNDHAMNLTFYTENMSNHFGIGTSILTRKIECYLQWNHKNQITNLTCNPYKRDGKNDEIYELTTYQYKSENKDLIELKGQILEKLIPKRKIEMMVPLTGKILITETELPVPGAEGNNENKLLKPSIKSSEGPKTTKIPSDPPDSNKIKSLDTLVDSTQNPPAPAIEGDLLNNQPALDKTQPGDRQSRDSNLQGTPDSDISQEVQPHSMDQMGEEWSHDPQHQNQEEVSNPSLKNSGPEEAPKESNKILKPRQPVDPLKLPEPELIEDSR